MSTQTEHEWAIGDLAHVIDEEHDHFSEVGTVIAINKSGSVRISFEDGKATFQPDQIEPVDDEISSAMAKVLTKYRHKYVTSVSASGRKSKACGDALSQALEGLDHKAVARLADRVFGLVEGGHEDKYAHLNNGQVRMNSGNRIRAAIKRGDVELADVLIWAKS